MDIKKLLCFSLLFAFLSSYAKAEDYYDCANTTYDVLLYAEAYDYSANEDPDIPPIEEPSQEHKKPGRRIQCSINNSGIEIKGFDISEIYSFEIYDFEGNCIAYFSNPEDFVQTIFHYNENIKIKLLTSQYVLSGYL